MAQDEVRKVEAQQSATRSTIQMLSIGGVPRYRLDFRPPGLSHRVAHRERDIALCDPLRVGFYPPLELLAVNPHFVQDHRQFAGYCYTGFLDAASL